MSERKAIDFAETGEPAKINYSIPMPGAHTGRRVIEIDLDMSEPVDTVFSPDAIAFGESPSDLLGARLDETIVVDAGRARSFFADELSQIGVTTGTSPRTTGSDLPGPVDQPADFMEPIELEPSLDEPVVVAPGTINPEATAWAPVNLTSGLYTMESLGLDIVEPVAPTLLGSSLSLVDPSVVEEGFAAFLSRLKSGAVMVPARDWSGAITTVTRPLFAEPDPRFFIVERYGVSSFLGDYGMGRTIKTFTLLPGESTTISLKTWRTTKESQKDASSIIDSHQQSARERFAKKVQKETTDKQTKKKTEKWHAEAEVGASWGFGSAKISGGGGGEYHSGREQFAKRLSSSVAEHAAEASAKRELSVTSSSERTNESGEESVIERTISNVNKRRVLNFVFRELNQTYVTKLHLKDVRIGYTNGMMNSWREVSVSQLLPLLRETLQPSIVDKVAKQILRAVAHVFDHADTAIPVLEQVRLRADGTGAQVSPAITDSSGNFDAPADDVYYRFRGGPLNQEGQANQVDGVLLSQQEITMRTDSVVVEALLGQADALDNYAMEVQEAASSKETLANKRDELILKTLEQIADPVERAKLAVQLLSAICREDDEETEA